MKSLSDILAELQAVDTTSLDGVVAALAQVQTDLQAVIAAATPVAAPTVASVTVTFSDGTTQVVPPTTA